VARPVGMLFILLSFRQKDDITIYRDGKYSSSVVTGIGCGGVSSMSGTPHNIILTRQSISD